MFRDTRVHVVIPAYNVASHLEAVLRGVPDYVDTVTVVDDASTDDTAEVAKAVGDPRVTVLGSPVNEGVGGAMARGFEHALALEDGIIVKMDGDGQMDPADLPRLLEPIVDGRCEYAKGNRFLRSRELDIMPKARLAGTSCSTFLTKLASGYWNVFDPQNGYCGHHLGRPPAPDLDASAAGTSSRTTCSSPQHLRRARVRCGHARPLRRRSGPPCALDASSAPSPSIGSSATGTVSTASTYCATSRR